MSSSGRSLVLIGLAGFVVETGCTARWQVDPGDAWLHDELRVEWSTDEMVSLRNPDAVGDTLGGVRAVGDTQRIALEQVDEITVARTDGVKSAALVGGVIVLAVGISLAVLAASGQGRISVF